MSFLFFRYFIGTLFFCIVTVSANIATGEREISNFLEYFAAGAVYIRCLAQIYMIIFILINNCRCFFIKMMDSDILRRSA